MKPRRLSQRHIVMTLVLMFASTHVFAAGAAPIPHHTEDYSVNSGLHLGTDARVSAFSHEVRVSGAPWLRLLFGEHNLGRASYLLVTSLEDGAKQRLDARSLMRWKSTSAFLNGEAVKVELHVAPGDRDVFFEIREVVVGERVGAATRSHTTPCCDGDGRGPGNDPAVGRLIPSGCTGWIVANGAHLTAGHCAPFSSIEVLEFNVPPSMSDGTIVPAAPGDQYPVDLSTVVLENNGRGDDWAVFACERNANTGLLPAQGQGAFYRMQRPDDFDPPCCPGGELNTAIRVTGFGLDDEFHGSTGGLNGDSQTQQTDTGTFRSAFTDSFSFENIKIEPGSSGSPAIYVSFFSTFGIVTHCANSFCTWSSSNGTSFDAADLRSAIQMFPGGAVEYVDPNHLSPFESGTVFRPFDTVDEAVQASATGGIISIVSGNYDETLVLDRAVTLTAPVGSVVIGE